MHVALIMNGSDVWAKKHRLSIAAGYEQSGKTLVTILATLPSHVTIFTTRVFPIEYWHKPLVEVYQLLQLIHDILLQQLDHFISRNIKVRFIGQLDMFPDFMLKLIQHAEKETVQSTGLLLNICMSYGSRQEIESAAKRANYQNTGTEQCLYTANLPDPNILICTGDIRHLDNFLLWQLAYTELIFVSTLWPDFTCEQFNALLE